MNVPEDLAGDPSPGIDPSVLGELRERLWAARTQETAARAAADRLARELALTRRLLKFYLGAPLLPTASVPTADPATVLLSEELVYHLDACEERGTHTALSGWAFRPAPGWDARATRVTLLLRHGDTVYATACEAVRRPDVAAFYAGQPPGAGGGATGLDGVGFACEIRHDALPEGTEWKIILRLECAGQACEQFTGKFLRS